MPWLFRPADLARHAFAAQPSVNRLPRNPFGATTLPATLTARLSIEGTRDCQFTYRLLDPSIGSAC